MKMIDEKGKLFGKFNIVDIAVAILVVFAVLLVGFKFVAKDGPTGSAGTKLTYTVMVSGVTQELYNEVAKYIPGDQLMASGDLLDAYVTDISATPRINYSTNSDGVVLWSEEENGRLDVMFTIEAMVANKITSEVGTQEVRIGKSHIVKTTNFEFINGTIQTCDWAA